MTTKPVMKHYKIALIGERGVGRSAMAETFVYGHMTEVYDPTLEGQYRKQCVIDDELAFVEVLDGTMQEGYGDSAIPEEIMREGNGFLLIYAITSRASFIVMSSLYQRVLRIKGLDSIPMVLVANRCDAQRDRQVAVAEGQDLAKKLGCKFFEASARRKINVDEAFSEVVREIRRYHKERIQKADILADEYRKASQHGSGCCGGCVVL